MWDKLSGLTRGDVTTNECNAASRGIREITGVVKVEIQIARALGGKNLRIRGFVGR